LPSRGRDLNECASPRSKVLAENQELWMSEKAQCAEKLKDIEDMSKYRRAMGKCISPVDTRFYKGAAEIQEIYMECFAAATAAAYDAEK
jgi:hypothetical protein